MFCLFYGTIIPFQCVILKLNFVEDQFWEEYCAMVNRQYEGNDGKEILNIHFFKTKMKWDET